MIIDYREAIAPVNDPANREIVRRLNSKTVKLSMFTTPRNATWAADRGLKVEAYPLANLSFPANRNFFRVEPGDQFKFSYPQWGISNMICRVVRITEEDLETGAIQVTAIEDIDHISAEAFGEAARGKWPIETETLSALEHVGIIEAPYVLAGDSVKVIPLAAKKAGTEAGYYLYMSIDGGVSYQKIGTIGSYQLYGILAEDYSADTYQIDEQTEGILVDFDVARTEDLDLVQSITRDQMVSGQNIALLGSEIITFQTATPVTATRYRLSGIFRGRYDTEKADHSAGEAFWFIGTDLFQAISHSELAIGANRKFKMVPFTEKNSGDISEASAVDYTITGRAKKPYLPGNLKANGSWIGRYSNDIVLTWTARCRGEGAGIGDPQTVLDAAPAFEYSFEVEVWVGGTLKRTEGGIEDDTWTYTGAMNIADNGALADSITFKVRHIRTENYIESDPAQITVYKE